jgi:hypothetical protein
MSTKRHRLQNALLALTVLLVGFGVASAQEETRVEGVIVDAAGEPVPECRVIARTVEGTTVFVSPPSDRDGQYSLDVPVGAEYVFIALISPTGGRVELHESAPVTAGSTPVTRNITIPMPVSPDPRGAVKSEEHVDRFFLLFVEDPALARYRYYEVQLGFEHFDDRDRTVLRGIGAFQFKSLPRVEIGASLGVADVDTAFLGGGTGLTDFDIWGKFLMHRTSNNRADFVIGIDATLPTGSADDGTGQDALQSHLFVSGSYAWSRALLIWHAGFVTAQDGETLGVSLGGETSGSAGVGLMLPLAPKFSGIFEANYEGERFKDTGATANLLFGVDWRVARHGQVRLALSTGLGETSDLIAFTAGYAFTY